MMTFLGLAQNDAMLLGLVILASLVCGWYATEGVKPQWVRVMDFVAYGPFLIASAYVMMHPDTSVGGVHDVVVGLLALALAFVGAATITYNLKNYIHESRRGSTSKATAESATEKKKEPEGGDGGKSIEVPAGGSAILNDAKLAAQRLQSLASRWFSQPKTQ